MSQNNLEKFIANKSAVEPLLDYLRAEEAETSDLLNKAAQSALFDNTKKDSALMCMGKYNYIKDLIMLIEKLRKTSTERK